MKKILTFTFALLISLFIIDKAASVVLQKLHNKSYSGVDSKINYLLQSPKKKSIIFGSSRANQSVIPSKISEDGFNLGAGGKFIAYSAGLVDLLKQHDKLPDTILMHIDLLSYQESKSKKYDKEDIRFLAPYYSRNEFIKNKINQISRFEFIKYFFSSYHHNGKLFSYLKNALRSNKKSAYPNQGFKGGKSKDSKKLQKIAKNLAKKIPENGPFELSQKAITYLNDIIKVCSEENVNIIFFTCPTFQNLKSADKKIQAEMETILKDYIYLNYKSEKLNLELAHNPKFWKDISHLNNMGAKVFSEKILEDIRK
jgi:hypothetical protein